MVTSSLRRLSVILLALLLIAFISVPPRANANPIAVAAGGVEIGALAFWGGAALIAATGTAVGMSPAVAAKINSFGKSAWVGANDAVKASITASVSGLANGWNTASRATVGWSSTAYDYLKSKWDEYFSGGVTVDSNGIITAVATLDMVVLPSYYGVGANYSSPKNLGSVGSSTIRDIFVNQWGVAEVIFYSGTYAAYSNLVHADGSYYKNAIDAFNDLRVRLPITDNAQVVTGTFSPAQGSGVTGPFIPVRYPQDVFPQSLNLPAPRGALNPDGTVAGYNTPTIGRVGGTAQGEIAVGFPTSSAGSAGLTASDSITAADTANPGTGSSGETKPKDDWPSKLKVAVTTRFPFSLPWDMAYLIGLFNYVPEVPVFTVPIGRASFTVKLDQLDPYMPYFHFFIIVSFLYGLVMKTRSLLGGGQ